MPYTIIDAMRDETKILKELEDLMHKEDRTIAAAVYREQRLSYNRMINRLVKGYEYDLVLRKGTPTIEHTETNRKTLEDEYPRVKRCC